MAGNSTVLVLLQADTCIDTEQDPGIDHRNRQGQYPDMIVTIMRTPQPNIGNGVSI